MTQDALSPDHASASLPPDPALSPLAALLIEARRTRTPIASVAPALVPVDRAAAYAVQDEVAAVLAPALGPIAGWKVGAADPGAEPFCAPIHAATIFADKAVLPRDMFFHVGVEAEIVYWFGRSLPPRETPYAEAEVLDAIASAHAGIEIFDSRFAQAGSQDARVHMADQGNHGAMIVGPGVATWRDLEPLAQDVVEIVNGDTLFAHRGGNSAGDTRRLLVWLAHHAGLRGRGILQGDVVLSGSTTGTAFVRPGAAIAVRFPGFADVTASVV